MDFINELNENQREAVVNTEGPTLVIAGAGSGKTRVLTYRIANLLSKGVPAYRILALTFTNKAAREMQKRIATLVGQGNAANLWMGTFHSIFSKILRVEAEHLGYTSNFTIYDSQDSKNLIKSIVKDLKLDDKVYKPTGDYLAQKEDKTTREFISYLKQEPLLKAILAGHLHITVEEQFSPTARQYVVAGNFLLHGREVLFV